MTLHLRSLQGLLLAGIIFQSFPTPASPAEVQHNSNQQAGKKQLLSMQEFVSTALDKHPALTKLREGYREQRNLAKKSLAIKELLLSASSGLNLTDPVYAGTVISADRLTRWNFESTLTKTFPELAGMTAGLSLGQSTAVTGASGGGSSTVATPYIGISLSFPLIKNALGSADRLTLEKMGVSLAIIDKSEEEATELLIQSLASQYYAWSLATEKEKIYQGFFERAGQYYNQVLRRANMGIADQSDIMLARQNWLSYQTSWLTAQQTANELSLGILAQLGIKANGSTNLVIKFTPKTSLPPLQTEALAWSLAPARETNIIIGLRPIQLARLSLENAKQISQIASDSTLPKLDLILRGTKTASDESLDRALGSLAGNTLFAGINFSLPLQNSAEEYSAQAAKNNLAAQTKTFETVLLETQTSISQYRLALITWRQLEKIAEDTSAAAAGRVAAVFTRYQQGRATLNNLTDAQDAWSRTRIQALETRWTLRRIELEFASLTDRLTQDVLP